MMVMPIRYVRDIDAPELVACGGDHHDGIADENFGRLLRVTDPDGMVIQINEHDPQLYG
jgi:hypothetical protein